MNKAPGTPGFISNNFFFNASRAGSRRGLPAVLPRPLGPEGCRRPPLAAGRGLRGPGASTGHRARPAAR